MQPLALAQATTSSPEPRPWRPALAWSCLLGLLFFLTYGSVNNLTAQRHDVQTAMFPWEHHIPFIAWTIIPYWSIDLFYGLSCFYCATRQELNRLVRRLLTAQLICVTGFLLFPLRFSMERPTTDGLAGFLFNLLGAFDKPYNQAPSLHICLLVILWQFYLGKSHSPLLKNLLRAWFCLIGLSVLTTYQHHVIDLLTGIWAGCLCLFLVPKSSARWQLNSRHNDTRCLQIASRYLAGAAILISTTLLAQLPPLITWVLAWSGASLALVGLIYRFGEAAHFSKLKGQIPWWNRLLLAPYLLAAQLNAWLWTRKLPQQVEVAPDVWLGRLPHNKKELSANNITSMVDLCAELPLPASLPNYHAVPILDLTTPAITQLSKAARSIQSAQRPVLVCCALGFSRSATALLAWLVQYQGMEPQQALTMLRNVRPEIVLDNNVIELLAESRTSS